MRDVARFLVLLPILATLLVVAGVVVLIVILVRRASTQRSRIVEASAGVWFLCDAAGQQIGCVRLTVDGYGQPAYRVERSGAVIGWAPTLDAARTLVDRPRTRNR